MNVLRRGLHQIEPVLVTRRPLLAPCVELQLLVPQACFKPEARSLEPSDLLPLVPVPRGALV